MNRTGIEWCDYTWNPIVGCSPAHAGCAHCYAEAISKRFGYPWGSAHFRPERLEQPAKVRQPSRVFVCSMGDLFHETVQPEWLEAVWAVMRANQQHTFLLLTKRPLRAALEIGRGTLTALPNVWAGCTVCDQAHADAVWPVFAAVPAAWRFVSVEPMLGPVTFSRHAIRPDWVIAGPETGPSARPCDDSWLAELAAESPCFFDKRKSWTRREFPMPNDKVERPR